MSPRLLQLGWTHLRVELSGLIYMHSAHAYDRALCDLIALRARP